MKALTIWQPWADLTVRGYKHWETRPRGISYRGQIAIHAAQYHKLPHAVYMSIARAIGIAPDRYEESWLHDLEIGKPADRFGAVLGIAEITGCEWTKDIRVSDQERALGDYTPGRAAWHMESIYRFENPIPARGMQGLWNWDGAP